MQFKKSIIYLAGFLFSMPLALTSYINSSYLKTYIPEDSVSMVYVVASLIAIIGMLQMPKILNKLGNRHSAMLFSTLGFFALLTLAFSGNIYIAIGSFVLYFISSFFILMTLDIFVEDFSKNTSVGTFRGLYLVTLSFAWIVAQSVSGSILAKNSYKGIYLFAALFMFLFIMLFMVLLKKFEDPKYKKVAVWNTIKFVIKDRKISKIYAINFILKFFYAWMIVYLPIHLHEYIGFSWQMISPLFTIMLLPFVIVTFPLGKLSDKIGEKKMLIIGFIIAMLSTALIPFIKTPDFALWAIVLFFTRVGAATIEVMSESYFFKCETEEDADVLSFFRNTSPLSFVIAPLIALPIIYLEPSLFLLFFVLSGVLAIGLYISTRIQDVR